MSWRTLLTIVFFNGSGFVLDLDLLCWPSSTIMLA
jgi:hypothetical protein